MWGRAGRRREGIALYVAGEDALDQFFCRHPDEFLERPVEAAILDHTNERIQLAAPARRGLRGAARRHRRPARRRDDEILGERWRERADALVGAGKLRRAATAATCRAARASRPARSRCARPRSTRSRSSTRASGEMLGSVEAERAFTTVHPGAIYLHLGRSYEVARARHRGPPRDRRRLRRRLVHAAEEGDDGLHRGGRARSAIGPAGAAVELHFGEVSVTEQVIAYQRKRLDDHEVIDLVALDLPEQNFPTQALWYVLPDALAGPAALPPDVQLGALHATEHSQIAVLPLLAMCDRWDIGGLSTNVHFQTGRPTIFIYDGHPGGVGIARRGYDEFERLVADAARLVGECPCEAGCPSCVQSPKCGNLNEPLHKAGALELMDRIITLMGLAAR